MSGSQQPTDLRKLIDRFSPEEMVIAAGSLVLLVALFLDWIGVDCGGLVPLCSLGGGSGFHGWGWLTFLALVGVAGLLVARRLFAERLTLPDLPASDPVLTMGGGALEVVGALLYWVEYHGSYTSMRFGWYLALLAGIATIAGGYLTTRTPQPAPRRHSPPHAPARP
jgi:hypothetical protein